MTGRIEGKIALVTGAASGLGAAIVRRFHAGGAAIMHADIDEAQSTILTRSLGLIRAAGRDVRGGLDRCLRWG